MNIDKKILNKLLEDKTELNIVVTELDLTGKEWYYEHEFNIGFKVEGTWCSTGINREALKHCFSSYSKHEFIVNHLVDKYNAYNDDIAKVNFLHNGMKGIVEHSFDFF